MGKGQERCEADRSVQGDLVVEFLLPYSLNYVVSALCAAEAFLFLPTHVLREDREQPWEVQPVQLRLSQAQWL